MSKDRLRVCILGPAYPYKGGIAAFNERLAQVLTDQGHEVDLITFTLQYPSFLYPGKTQYVDGPPPEGLKISRSLNTINPITWVSTGMKIKKNNYDLIITRFWLPVIAVSMGYTLRSLKGKSATTVIAIIDNIIPHEKRPGDSIFTRYFMKAIDGGITLSEEVAQTTRKLFPTLPVQYHPHPIYDIYGEKAGKEASAEKLGLDPERNYILYFGYIRDYKGLDLLLKAFASVAAEIPDTDILVAGEYYTDSTLYLNLIEALNIKDRVILHTDFIADHLVKYYFGISSLISQTYKSASQSGVSQIAIHFEKPMICTRVGGLPEVIEPGTNGLVVDPEIEDVAKGLLVFMNDPDSYYNSSKARQLRHEYSWEVFNDVLMEMYKNISIQT
jgi:glycosyltransferase involved in cell wall biosynthesis